MRILRFKASCFSALFLCLTLQTAEKIETKFTVESRNKICIFNVTVLRICEGNEVNRGFLFKHR